MSFFTTSTGDNLSQGQTGSYSDDFAPIPKDTRVLAVCEEAKIGEYNNARNINLKWKVAQPKEFAGRIVFQKIYALDLDPQVLEKHGKEKAEEKRDRALRMLAAIDANAGGKLAKANTEPTDHSLSAALTNRPMVLKLGVWELEDKSKSGNWVQEVSKHKGAAAPAPAPAPVAAPRASGGFDDMDDDIPFSDPLKTRGMHAVM